MKLSIVIVNYNVKYFLHQALDAVFKSQVSFDYDVYVVDNSSSDDSVEMVRQEFPQVKLIASTENLGFSKGNNLAIRQSDAEYVLLLNPDTIIREDTLAQVVQFMDERPDAGALGVKMYDGQGIFLPESKRGFPSPKVAFYKMSGLSRLFPKSKIFGEYHLGYLSEDEIHEVDVLSGAFMLLRKSCLDQVGLLDEDYFMYGEDIDLSYRIQKAGYKNYYYPFAPIIHFKGESTKKGSLNYVKVFYQAMIIFAQKHFKNSGGQLYIFLLKIAIYLRALLTLCNRVFSSIGYQLLDTIVLVLCFIGFSQLWEKVIKVSDNLIFPITHYKFNLPIYAFTWVFINYLMGAYEKSNKIYNVWSGMLLGTAIIGSMYGFFPNEWRTSRGLILSTFIAGTALMSLYRILIFYKKSQVKQLFSSEQKLIIVGSYEESKRVIHLLNDISINRTYLGFITPNKGELEQKQCLGHLDSIKKILEIENTDEIIFCAKDISSFDIIHQIATVHKEYNFKIATPKSNAIIGSHSKDESGELLTYDIGFRINKPYLRRLKRIVDVGFSFIFLTLSPLFIWFQKHPFQYFKNIVLVLLGEKTWVAYAKGDSEYNQRPPLQNGVLSPLDNLHLTSKQINSSVIERQNYLYAKNYHIITDIQTILNSLGKLSTKSN